MDHVSLQLILIAVLLMAGITDVRSWKIPNWLTMSAMVVGLVGHGLLNGPMGAFFSLKGLGVGLALFIIPYLFRAMGAGDVKLLAAVGAFVGVEGVILAGLITALLGGLYALAVMTCHWGVRTTVIRIIAILRGCVLLRSPFVLLAPPQGQPQLRYGLVIGLGTLMSLWVMPLFTS